MKTMLNVISLGAGVQSSTMALMAAKGEITPMPDAAIFADTKFEPAHVYSWLSFLEKQLPFPVYRVHAKTALRDEPGRLPLFIKSGGILSRSCTEKHKIRPIMKKLRELMGLSKGERTTTPAIMWIGISIDEATRMKPSRVLYSEHRWPLIDAGMSRNDCFGWMKANGYPKPQRSSCIICPYHSNDYWRDMKLNQPGEFQEAVDYDNKIRNEIVGWAKDKRDLRREDDGFQVYLHNSLKPLGEVDFRNLEDMGQLNMFENECEGHCGV